MWTKLLILLSGVWMRFKSVGGFRQSLLTNVVDKVKPYIVVMARYDSTRLSSIAHLLWPFSVGYPSSGIFSLSTDGKENIPLWQHKSTRQRGTMRSGRAREILFNKWFALKRANAPVHGEWRPFAWIYFAENGIIWQWTALHPKIDDTGYC